MKKLILFFILLISISAFAQEDYQKVRVFFNSDKELQQAVKLAQTEPRSLKKGVFFECEIPKERVQKIQAAGLKIEILEPNLKEYYERLEREYYQKSTANSCSGFILTDPVNYKAGTMGGYLNYNEIFSELQLMKTLYPNLITAKAPISTFKTFENRELYFVKISDHPETEENEKRILYTALHHAREPGSSQQLIYFMWYLLENYATNPEIKTLLDNTEIYVVPIVNPDGFSYNQSTNPNGGGMWRKNRRSGYGVDNNRNYSYQWGTTGTSNNTSDDTYCGPSPFSEPENQAIKWLCEQKNFGVAINAHTHSRLVLYPYGYDYNQPTPDDLAFQMTSAEMVKYNGYENKISSELYPASGDSDDWMYGDTSTKPKIFAYTPEIGSNFWEPTGQIKNTSREMAYTNLTALRILHNYATLQDTTEPFITQLNSQFSYSLKRLGLVDNQNFSVKIMPITSNIESVGTANIHSGIAIGQSVSGTIALNLKPSVVNGDAVSFKVEVDNGNYVQSEIITKHFGEVTIKFSEPGNSITQWTKTGNWGTTTTQFVSSPTSITDSPSGNYGNNSQTTIKTTNSINLAEVAVAQLEFYARWNIEKSYDFVALEVSTDGNTWQQLCGKYTSTGSSNQIAGQPIYDGVQNTWVKEQIDLSAYIGQQIYIRFRFKSDGYVTEDGFYFDDLSVKTLSAENLGVSNPNSHSLKIFPNPASDRLFVKNFEKFTGYRIFSMNGDLLNSGKTSATIDVSKLVNGLYLIEFVGESTVYREKFLIKK